jgi:hypothetical protein
MIRMPGNEPDPPVAESRQVARHVHRRSDVVHVYIGADAEIVPRCNAHERHTAPLQQDKQFRLIRDGWSQDQAADVRLVDEGLDLVEKRRGMHVALLEKEAETEFTRAIAGTRLDVIDVVRARVVVQERDLPGAPTSEHACGSIRAKVQRLDGFPDFALRFLADMGFIVQDSRDGLDRNAGRGCHIIDCRAHVQS